MTKYIFIRNDDVRQTLDHSLRQITELCIQNRFPISHTVEPANVSTEVIRWLLDMKQKFPEYIEIVQHGYSHKLNYQNLIGGKVKKGEFGGHRSYKEQFREIIAGKNLMDKYFEDNWFPLFTFPYGARNIETILAINNAGFKAINGSMGISYKHRILYYLGQILNKEMINGRKISYNLKYRKGMSLFQIDTSISVIKNYVNEEQDAIFYSIDELKLQTQNCIKQIPSVGIVLHHRYHNSVDKIRILEQYIRWLKNLPNVHFVKQEFLFNKFATK